MNKENKLPTAYDMLKNQLFPSEQARSTIAGKIEEHTRLHTASLREELKKLRAENERLKKDFSDLQSAAKDMQEYLYRGESQRSTERRFG